MLGLPTETTVVFYLNEEQYRTGLVEEWWGRGTITNAMRHEWFLSHGYDEFGKPAPVSAEPGGT